MAYIDYYEGAFGDAIIIRTCSKSWLISLKETIHKLIDGNIERMDICKIADTKCSETFRKLEVILVEKPTVPSITLDDDADQICVHWSQDREEILTLLGLVDGLLFSGSYGHQYLAHEEDGCSIELSFNEC